MSQDYRSLIAWQWADAFACDVYLATRSFPSEELYGGLGSLLREQAALAAAQIVEGALSEEFWRFRSALREARRALGVCDYYLLLASRLGYLDEQVHRYLQELRDDAWGVVTSFSAALEAQTSEEQRATRAAGGSASV